jgi:SNF2 family DNA or RNA helicase
MALISNTHYNFDTKHQAFNYQHEAFIAIKDKPYAAIFHEQGLGKTKIAIDLLLYWLTQANIDTVLIVTKKQLVQNWVNEFDTHTYIRPKTLDNKKGNNFFVLNSPAKVIITNFETISVENERIKLFLQTRNVGMIIDESTKIKNPDSKLTKDFFEIAPLLKRKVIMTGTPVANRPYDMWAQIFFLDNGESLGRNFSEFKAQNDLSNDLSEDKSKRKRFEDSVASIFRKIKDFSVRETKDSGIIHLPDKIYHNLYIHFEQQQASMYETIRTEMQLAVQKDGISRIDESEEVIKRLLRLVQITSNPKLIDEQYDQICAKELLLDKVLNRVFAAKEKVIVWSIFTENIDYYCKKYKDKNAVKITGKMTIEDRNKSVDRFKNGDAQVLFATPQSAKEGLTLTVANNAVFYDRGFNLDDYLQAQDRIHRISQTKDCNIYNLMIEDSVDVWIDLLLQAKQKAAFLAQGDINLDNYKNIADYSFGDIVNEILNAQNK